MHVVSQIFWQIVYLGILAAVLGVPIAVFLVQLGRVRAGRSGKGKAFLLSALAALAPTVLYVAFFFGMVGLEEVTGAAIIPEGIGRSFLIVVGLGLLWWLLTLIPFAVLIARARVRSA